MSQQHERRLEPIETVSLELLRPGPAHGQLLSPLTSYMALCGDEGPVTLRIELEHWKLMNSLRRLRYVAHDRRQASFVAVPDPIRESEILELGNEVSRILSDIPTLASELGGAAGRLGSHCSSGAGLVHLRLILSGSELSLIPFELVVSPQGLPGDGLAMLLQTRMPIIVTREVRRGAPPAMDWNRRPRILVVAAAPGPLTIPLRAHLLALRKALDPWVRWAPDTAGRAQRFADLVTVLPDASIEDIGNTCERIDYTHVHVLAHGDSYEEAGQPRYGLALCHHLDRSRKAVVDGKRLAEALRMARSNGRERSRPLVVTLATCDSGNVESVVVPGGSIAHDLHAFGIPWVFASQFPLTKSGSVRMTEFLYESLLRGEDPRRLLHRLRATLHFAAGRDHDWASVVAYASIPQRFDLQVHSFRSRQMRDAVENDLERAELHHSEMRYDEADAAIDEARSQLKTWQEGLTSEDWERDLPEAVRAEARGLRAECYGIFGATEKRAAGLYFDRSEAADAEPDKTAAKEKSTHALERCRELYLSAMQTGMRERSHWPATQYLSISAVLRKRREPETFDGTFTWASQDLASEDKELVAWANGTLAELELLRLYHNRASIQSKAPGDEIKRRVRRHCREILRLAGPESFQVMSTRRQFERYRSWWKHPTWQEVAEAAISELSSPTAE